MLRSLSSGRICARPERDVDARSGTCECVNKFAFRICVWSSRAMSRFVCAAIRRTRFLLSCSFGWCAPYFFIYVARLSRSRRLCGVQVVARRHDLGGDLRPHIVRMIL